MIVHPMLCLDAEIDTIAIRNDVRFATSFRDCARLPR